MAVQPAYGDEIAICMEFSGILVFHIGSGLIVRRTLRPSHAILEI
jgi:hypothetical protein